MTKAQRAERDEAITKLREMIKPGDTVYTILDHVSSSGMSRAIRVVVPYTREDGTIDHLHPNYSVGKALQLRHWKRNGREQDALLVGGCGMDMGFHLVYELSSVLYGGRLTPDIYTDDARTENTDGTGRLLTRDGAPAGEVYIGGYRCLGKGKCPSNYHSNHHDMLRCEGTRTSDGEGNTTGYMCYAPDAFSRYQAPEGWPRDVIDIGEGKTIEGRYLACLLDGGEERDEFTICPTCKGVGRLPNPAGPERFDLVHTDGYALRHRWL